MSVVEKGTYYGVRADSRAVSAALAPYQMGYSKTSSVSEKSRKTYTRRYVPIDAYETMIFGGVLY